jgi:(p)ppGpp synthase/HD superfamily hydrolase
LVQIVLTYDYRYNALGLVHSQFKPLIKRMT